MREIQALRRLSPNQHVITLEEVLYDQPTGRLALVFELMDANLYELIRGRRHYLNGQVRQKEETGSRIVTTASAYLAAARKLRTKQHANCCVGVSVFCRMYV